jgi:hypothetical protein
MSHSKIPPSFFDGPTKSHDTNYYAHEITLSVNVDFRGTWTQEILAYLDNNFMWYAIKHEQDSAENKKLHLHIGAVKEIGYRQQHPWRGAVACGNLKKMIKNNCKEFGKYIDDHNQHRAIVVSKMDSDRWFTIYMQKEADCVYHRMPKDLTELGPYFADLEVEKSKNPEFTRIAKLYNEEDQELPATAASVWEFLTRHMLIESDMKEWTQKALSEKPPRIAIFINKDIPDNCNPHLKKPKIDRYEEVRYCQFCPEGVSHTLEPRKQKCYACLQVKR